MANEGEGNRELKNNQQGWMGREGEGKKELEDYVLLACLDDNDDPIYPTPPLGQDMTQGQFLSGV